MKREVNCCISTAKEDHKKKLIARLEDPRTPPKQYWNIYKQIQGTKINSNIPTLINDNQQYTTATSKANLLAEYFASQSQEPQQPDLEVLHQLPESHRLTNITVNEGEVLRVLQQLNINKAPGPDGNK